MDLNSLTQAELHSGVSLLLIQIVSATVQIREVLTKTEKFDAKASLDFIASMEAAIKAANEILMDSLRRQGLSDEQIESRIEYFKEMFGNGSTS